MARYWDSFSYFKIWNRIRKRLIFQNMKLRIRKLNLACIFTKCPLYFRPALILIMNKNWVNLNFSGVCVLCCLHMCMCTCSHVWPDVDTRISSSITHHLVFWDRVSLSLTEPGAPISEWLARKPPESTCLWPSCSVLSAFMWVLGI